jgi:hypothetical protein
LKPLSDIKLLLLNVNRDGWHSGNMIYDMEAVKRACNVQFYGPGWPDYKYTNVKDIIEQLYGDGKPDVIYSYFTENETVRDCYVKHYGIPEELRRFHQGFGDIKGVLKIFALSDFWARKPEQYSRDLIGSGFQYCFACFAPPYSNPKDFNHFFNDQVRKEIKFVGYPRCVDKECFKDYGSPKKYDVITLGAMWHFYPLRVHMHRYLSKYCHDMKIRYYNYPHCGTDFQHGNFVREKYAMAINESKMLASCGGIYHVAMNKIFEAMGCGTVYVGEKPFGEEELHLRDGFNYIAVDSSNFKDKILHYLNSPDDMNAIVRNAQETFLRYHHIDARANDFVGLLKTIL